ncbi:MAG: WG repeat-containing protein, partial [Erysipelotrichales bacterium]|nr:WG repeat-containing protein [Erysipelotrichales bacterium]
SFYANNEEYMERLLYCDLYVNNGNDHYSFFYDLHWNTIYMYTDTVKEELFFTDDLHQKILTYCKEKHLSYYEKYRIIRYFVEELYTSIDQDVHCRGDALTERHDYKRLNTNVLFGKDVADAVFPFIQKNESTVVESLYVVMKDNAFGVVNADGTLAIPYQCNTMPSGNVGDGNGRKHIHCHYNDVYFVSDVSIYNVINGTHKYCFGQHGGNSFTYYYLEDSQELVIVTQGHDGPDMLNNIDGEKLAGKLNLYHSLQKTTEENDDIVTFYDGRTINPGDALIDEGYISFSQTEKYGVFSANGKLTEPIYDNGLALNTDLVAVQKNGLWGYVNAEGIEVIPCQYQTIYTFQYNGYTNDYIYPALNNSIVVKNTAGFFGVLDYQGNTLVDFTYEWISPFTDGNVLVKTNNEWHIMDPFTQQILK